MVEVGFVEDTLSRSYDFVNMGAILLNLTVSILFTYDNINKNHGSLLNSIETITVFFFLVDYALRIWTAEYLYPDLKPKKATQKYIFSFIGIIDLLSFLPYYLPIFFPMGSVAFRMLRVARIFRLFRINAYYDSLNVIAVVIKSKKQQLLSSLFIIIMLMIASSLCMYSLEHNAQPEIFSNAFSGIWWATSTLLTVGYGDIYPITTAGKALSILITFLGVGMVAIPTGIISAGFVEQYSLLRQSGENSNIGNLRLIKIHIKADDLWAGKRIDELRFPSDMIVAAIQRNNDFIVPGGDVIIIPDDIIVLGAKHNDSGWEINLQEVTVSFDHPWINTYIRDLDISRQTFIITVGRGENTLVPRGNLKLKENDKVLIYTKKKVSNSIKVNL